MLTSPMSTDPHKLVGRLANNRYVIGPVLGSGGLCTVYRSEDLRRQRDVAVKVLPAEKAQVEELAARFQREITTSKLLDHPNVASISDSGKLDDGAHFLVMELRGESSVVTSLHSA
jgi:serine/threonine-protein kinase